MIGYVKDTLIPEINEDFETERTERKTADENLQSQITQEVADRKSGDENLQSQITQEIADRQAADDDLQEQITQEISDRTAADSNLQTQLNNEISARKAGDSSYLAQANAYTDSKVGSIAGSPYPNANALEYSSNSLRSKITLSDGSTLLSNAVTIEGGGGSDSPYPTSISNAYSDSKLKTTVGLSDGSSIVSNEVVISGGGTGTADNEVTSVVPSASFGSTTADANSVTIGIDIGQSNASSVSGSVKLAGVARLTDVTTLKQDVDLQFETINTDIDNINVKIEELSGGSSISKHVYTSGTFESICKSLPIGADIFIYVPKNSFGIGGEEIDYTISVHAVKTSSDDEDGYHGYGVIYGGAGSSYYTYPATGLALKSTAYGGFNVLYSSTLLTSSSDRIPLGDYGPGDYADCYMYAIY